MKMTIQIIATMLVLVLAGVLACIRILPEYTRGVIFTLGRFTGVKGPGLILVIPGIQVMVRVDLRVQVMDVPSQDVISRDNVSVKVNAVVYFPVIDPEKSIIQGRGLSHRHQSARADDPALGARSARTRRDARRARQAQ
jgi:SPFH domain, Band 7 family protein